MPVHYYYSKTCFKRSLKKNTKIGFQYRVLMQVKGIAECSKGSILQYFRPSLSYQFSLRPLFCLFLSGRLRQVLLYKVMNVVHEYSVNSDYSPGFGAQLIGPIQLHVKRQNSSICKFFQDIASVSGKICHSPIKKVKRQPTLIISFSQHSPFFGEQSKNPG